MTTRRSPGYSNIVPGNAPADGLYSCWVQPRSASLPPFPHPIGVSMMTISSRAAVAAFASLMLMGSAFAQGTAAPAAPAAKTEKAEKAHTPESLECSKEADEKG